MQGGKADRLKAAWRNSVTKQILTNINIRCCYYEFNCTFTLIMNVSVSSSKLFERFRVGQLQLKHRLVMPPMTRLRAGTGNVPSDIAVEYYSQRSRRPGTLLITEGTYITKNAGYDPDVPGVWSQSQIEGWKRVTSAIHDNGSFVFIQLWSLGGSASPEMLTKYGIDYVAPSAFSRLTETHGFTPRALSTQEIRQYVKDFVTAAQNAILAGADGIEIHNANGYLPDQFLHEDSNRRTDEYGGSIENRARFSLEVVDALVDAIGADRVGIRLSPWTTFKGARPGISPIPQWAYLTTELERRGQNGKRLAYIHIVEPRVSGGNDVAPEKYLNHYDGNHFFRDIWNGVLIKAGSLVDEAKLIASREPNTLIAVGRYWISNPDLPDRLEKNLELTNYDRQTFYTSGAEGYTTYTSYKYPSSL